MSARHRVPPPPWWVSAPPPGPRLPVPPGAEAGSFYEDDESPEQVQRLAAMLRHPAHGKSGPSPWSVLPPRPRAAPTEDR